MHLHMHVHNALGCGIQAPVDGAAPGGTRGAIGGKPTIGGTVKTVPPTFEAHRVIIRCSRILSGVRGEYGRDVPVRDDLVLRATEGGLAEVYPAACPVGHDIGPGAYWASYSHYWGLRQLTCRTCFAVDPGAASWALIDPAYSQHTLATMDGRGLELVAIPPDAPARVGQIVLSLDSVTIGDVDVAYCADCRIAVLHHIRVDPPFRRRGLGRVLWSAALARAPRYAWSTTEITDAAALFWASVDVPRNLAWGRPAHCRHAS